MPTFIDLSAPISQSPAEWPDALRTDIEYPDHARARTTIEALLGVPPRLLRDGEGWAVETLNNFGTHNSTHVDAPWHYNSTVGGERAQTIDELPLEWFFKPGVVLDMTHKADGDPMTADDARGGARRRRARAAAARHRARAHRARRLLRRAGLHGARLRRDFRGHKWLYDQGVRVMGIDAWGWDAPLHLQAQEAVARDEPGIFWAAHQADLPYCQIERLFNLGELPPTGFTVACFPLKIVGGSAGPTRAVAVVP